MMLVKMMNIMTAATNMRMVSTSNMMMIAWIVVVMILTLTTFAAHEDVAVHVDGDGEWRCNWRFVDIVVSTATMRIAFAAIATCR